MSDLSRRKMITTGLAVTAGALGLGAAAGVAEKYGLVPPDHGGLYGVGETLTYAAQRLLTNHSLAREFPSSMVSVRPVQKKAARPQQFKQLQDGGFLDWRLSVDGLVDRPGSFSLAQLKSYEVHSQITSLTCEEGWSYIAEWHGVRLSEILDAVGVQPHARYVVYYSITPRRWDSIDMAEALHPQTIVNYGMNGDDLPVENGGPLRMRLPKQLGYKNVKYLNRLSVTDSLKGFGKGLGSSSDGRYAWYGGI